MKFKRTFFDSGRWTYVANGVDGEYTVEPNLSSQIDGYKIILRRDGKIIRMWTRRKLREAKIWARQMNTIAANSILKGY